MSANRLARLRHGGIHLAGDEQVAAAVDVEAEAEETGPHHPPLDRPEQLGEVHGARFDPDVHAPEPIVVVHEAEALETDLLPQRGCLRMTGKVEDHPVLHAATMPAVRSRLRDQFGSYRLGERSPVGAHRRDRREPRVDTQRVQDVADVVLHGLRAESQIVGDLTRGLALLEMGEDL